MINDQWLKLATDTLKTANIGSARLDALILLEDETGRDRAWILAHPEAPLQGSALQRLDKKLARRTTHEPLAYIRGFTEFYGRNFLINKDVLEPRPESETMVELLLDLAKSQKLKAESLTIADIGTGSGAIGITVKLEFPDAKVIGTDINKKCLVVAKKNAKELGADVEFLVGDLLQPLSTFDFRLSTIALLCNLPYVPDHWKINQAASMEPRIAIFGGKDGLDLYHRMFEQIKKLPWQPKYIFTESLPPQHEKLKSIAGKSGYKLQKSQDFIQVFSLT